MSFFFCLTPGQGHRQRQGVTPPGEVTTDQEMLHIEISRPFYCSFFNICSSLIKVRAVMVLVKRGGRIRDKASREVPAELKDTQRSGIAQRTDHELRDRGSHRFSSLDHLRAGGQRQDSGMGSKARTKLSLARGKCTYEKILQEAFVRAAHRAAKPRVKQGDCLRQEKN